MPLYNATLLRLIDAIPKRQAGTLNYSRAVQRSAIRSYSSALARTTLPRHTIAKHGSALNCTTYHCLCSSWNGRTHPKIYVALRCCTKLLHDCGLRCIIKPRHWCGMLWSTIHGLHEMKSDESTRYHSITRISSEVPMRPTTRPYLTYTKRRIIQLLSASDSLYTE